MPILKNQSNRMVTLSILLLLLVTFGVRQGHAERCAVLCDSVSLQDQCERCKLRVPMRFGKRSSPPQALLALNPSLMMSSEESDLPQALRVGGDDDNVDLNQQFFRLLIRSMRRGDTATADDVTTGDSRQRFGRRTEVDDVTDPDDAMWNQLSGNERKLTSFDADRRKRAAPFEKGNDDVITGSSQQGSTLRSLMRRGRGWIDASRLSKSTPSWNFPVYSGYGSPTYSSKNLPSKVV